MSGPVLAAIALGVIGWSAILILPVWRLTLATAWLTYGLLALSLVFVWGLGGIVSFGQTIFFGVSAYVYGILAINWASSYGAIVPILMGVVFGGVLLSAVLGYFLFYSRIGEMQVAILTFVVTLIFLNLATGLGPNIVLGSAVLGGPNGIVGIPSLTFSGTPMSPAGTHVVVVACCVAIYSFFKIVEVSDFGRVIAGMRSNPERLELLGYDVRRYRLMVFILGGAVAALAGALFAAQRAFMSPQVFSLDQAALVLIWVMVGGRSALSGAFLGAFSVNALSYSLGAQGGGGTQSLLVLGLVMIGVVLLLPDGIHGGLVSLWKQRAVATRRLWRVKTTGRRRNLQEGDSDIKANKQDESVAVSHPPLGKTNQERKSAVSQDRDKQTEVELRVTDLGKAFGGIEAVKGVSMALEGQHIHCLIGPNGAGKSTLFAMLVGLQKPDRGEIALRDEPITKLQPFERVRKGMGIKLQMGSIFDNLSVEENLWLAARSGGRLSGTGQGVVDETLGRIGLLGRRRDLAATLSHGEQQWLEFGMLIALGSDLILLDEPTAGMTGSERDKTASMIQEMASTSTVVVVEHDMDFVRRLDVSTTVLHQGEILTAGSVSELSSNPKVLEIYLGAS